MFKRNWLTLVALLILVPMAIAQEARDAIETRTYDVSDLLRATANYPINAPSGPGVGPGMGNAFPGEMQPPVNGDSLVHLIEDTVANDSWRDNGGNTGALRELGNVLVITQTIGAHNEINKLLTQLRSDPSLATMLSVHAYWVKLDPAELATVYSAAKTNNNVTAMPEISDKMLDKDHLYFMGQTTGFNGQTVHITGGHEFSYISDLTPVVSNSAVGYDPQVTIVQSGVQLQVTPQIMPSGDVASLDLHSVVTESTPGAAIPVEYPTTRTAVTPPNSRAIERRNILSQQFHTTVRVPLHKKLLIGGMTLEPAGKDGSRQLYLVVEVDAVK